MNTGNKNRAKQTHTKSFVCLFSICMNLKKNNAITRHNIPLLCDDYALAWMM
jgi:hypothetical protein